MTLLCDPYVPNLRIVTYDMYQGDFRILAVREVPVEGMLSSVRVPDWFPGC